MDTNPLKKIWQSGATAIGTMIVFNTDIATIRIAAAAGLDFVMFDLEHSPHTSQTLHDLAPVAHLGGMAPLITTPMISQQAIGHAQEL
jgi:2-dehydro-3-deoxyglucarate aldolase/4-hydroxy-2-oxoheptanedioate aldolase